MPDADRVHPQMQGWKPGDKLWMYPPERIGGAGSADLVSYEPGRALAFATRRIGSPSTEPHRGSWSFVVEPVSSREARLLLRGRGAPAAGPLAAAFDRLVFQPAHFVMERNTMTGIKARAEGHGPTPWADAIEIACWTLLALMFGASAILALRGRPLARALSSMLVAGALFQVLTFLGPGPVPSAVAVVAIALLVPWRSKSWPRSPTLLDGCLPEYEFCSVAAMRMHASPAAIIRAYREVSPAEMPIATWLATLRYLPSRIRGGPLPKASARPLLEELRAMHNIVLAERPDREVVIGMIGRLHDLADQHPVPLADAEAFSGFDRANHQKLAMSLRIVDTAGDPRVVFEHRTHALGRAAWWKFGLYWWLMIKWGSAIMVRVLLHAIERRAEREAAPTTARAIGTPRAAAEH
jgi:hypothetical protein